jgi:hypothetical protein
MHKGGFTCANEFEHLRALMDVVSNAFTKFLDKWIRALHFNVCVRVAVVGSYGLVIVVAVYLCR